eukprot:3713425-Pyramimonas_sp.AAC.1
MFVAVVVAGPRAKARVPRSITPHAHPAPHSAAAIKISGGDIAARSIRRGRRRADRSLFV